jgi:hypothetical protein
MILRAMQRHGGRAAAIGHAITRHDAAWQSRQVFAAVRIPLPLYDIASDRIICAVKTHLTEAGGRAPTATMPPPHCQYVGRSEPEQLVTGHLIDPKTQLPHAWSCGGGG